MGFSALLTLGYISNCICDLQTQTKIYIRSNRAPIVVLGISLKRSNLDFKLVSYIPMQMVQAYNQTQAIVHGSFVDPQLHHNVVDYKTIQIVQEYKKFFPFKQYFIANKSKLMVYIYDLVFSQSIFLNTNSIYFHGIFDEFFLY